MGARRSETANGFELAELADPWGARRGKDKAGAEWVKARATGQGLDTGPPARRIAIVAPTFDEARMVMIEGVSGLLAIHDESWRPEFEPSRRLLTWPNGCVAQVFTAEEPDGLRGPQFDAAWCDELAKWKYAGAVWDMLQFALRLGENPRAVNYDNAAADPAVEAPACG